MNPARWRQIKEIYQSALDLEPERRETLLREKCAGDDSLLQEVRSLLAQESGGLLDSPALDAAARALADEKAGSATSVLVGQTLRHYRITGKLGQGGMGVVYRAEDTNLSRQVAIKVLPDIFAGDPERLARFEREAKLLASLNHPNIAAIHGLEEHAGKSFLVLELVEGHTLAERLQKGPLPVEEAIEACRQIGGKIPSEFREIVMGTLRGFMGKKQNVHPRREFLCETGQKIVGLTLASALAPFASDLAHARQSKLSSAGTSPVTGYELDLAWPQKPESLGTWAGNPAIMIDSKQQIWVSNRAFPAMMVFDTTGNFLRAWDSPKLFSQKGPTLFQTKETGPYNLHLFRFDGAGNVWIANTNRHVIQRCDQDGNVLLTIGTLDVPGADDAHLSRPTDMTVTPAGVFISDGYGNRRIVHYTAEGKFIKAWGKEGTGPEDFIDPHAICHIKDHLYIVDRGNVRIKVYDFSGKLVDIWRDLILPWPLTPTADNGIWTCGCSPIRLENYRDITSGKLQQDQIAMKFSPEGKILQIWAFPTCPRADRHVPGKFNMLHGISIDAQGHLYLGEAFNPGPQRFIRSNTLKTSVQGEFPMD